MANKKIADDSVEVVHYYNILYNLENKDNKENKYASEVSSPADKDNICSSISSDLEPSGSQNPVVAPGHLGERVLASEMVNPEDLSDDDIERAVIQFFDNGEGTPQRYKLKVRLNLTDKENVEFIATLTTDWSNFKKYIPEDCKDAIKEHARKFRATIKREYNRFPYMGKFHLNQGRSQDTSRPFTQIEPWTWAFVWWDAENSIWKYHLGMYNWNRAGDFNHSHITALQTKAGVKGQDLFINPKYDKRERPKTWAQLRAEKRAVK
jgi:hypothetical protein